MELNQLIDSINQTADYFQREAVKQVNVSLTLRNWVIGCYLYEYEQNGQDRAVYGVRLYKEIAKRLKHIKGLSEPRLYFFKAFYLAYPQIFSTLSRKLQKIDNQYFVNKISQMTVDFIQIKNLLYKKSKQPDLIYSNNCADNVCTII